MQLQEPIPLSHLTIKLANPAQGKELLRAISNHAHWAGKVSFEGFCKLQDRAEKEGAWTADNGSLVWALVRRDDPEGEIFVACETHRTACFVRKAGAEDIEDGWLYGITTVISPAQHRGKGYGKHFMRLLHYILASPSDMPPFPAEWGSRPPMLPPSIRKDMPYAAASLLVSEIGPDFYERCTRGLNQPGWIANPAKQDCLIWELRKPSPLPTQWDHFPGGWTPLYDQDLPRIASALSLAARTALANAPTTDSIRIQPDPASPGILTFAHRFGSIMPLPPWYSTIDPMPIGLSRTLEDGRTAIVLVVMYNFQLGNRFDITYMHDVLPEDLASLLEALDQLVAPSDYTEGWVWRLSPDDPLVKAWQEVTDRNVRVSKREGSNLLSDAVYIGEGEIVDKQLWTWL